MTKRLLILGGTAEAVDLADQAMARFGAALDITSALAGRTKAPRTPMGRVRIGGFGGVDGLVDYLRVEKIDLVIDATHPFAATISNHAAEACAAARVARLVFTRPRWTMSPRDRWQNVPNNEVAAAAIETMNARRVFLSIGGRGLQPFARLFDRFFLVRMIESPVQPLELRDHRLLLARGPFSVDAERALMVEERIDLLVSRASGGQATEAKLIAARELGLPVVLIDRPAPAAGEAVDSVAAALSWLATHLRG
ncbi:MAG: cobalt-precorrin-6A reductase [Alphaproteobacteria bacterium]|nr:cobalt-precorrin-6A reductase [Alphaproteobacteria bacterium]